MPKAKIESNETAHFKNIPETYTDQDIRNILSEFGNITDFSINREKSMGSVSYSTLGAVQRVIQKLNGKRMEEQTFLIYETNDKKRANLYSNLYVGNIDASVTEEEIREVFEKFGEIDSLLLPTRNVPDGTGKFTAVRKNHVFINFKDSKTASNVIKEMDGRYYWDRNLSIDYYDKEMKKRNTEKLSNKTTPTVQNLAHDFMQAMMMMASTMSNSGMRGGRGGYNNAPNSGYRGSNNSYRGRGGGGGGRGNQRGRGSRGSHRGGSSGYHVRSQYESHKPMMSHGMGPPPMTGMGMPSAPPMSMQPMPISHPPPQYSHHETSMPSHPAPTQPMHHSIPTPVAIPSQMPEMSGEPEDSSDKVKTT